MSLTLDAAIEERVHREIARGAYREPSEVLSRAMDLLEADSADLESRRQALLARIRKSFAQAENGESFSPEEARAELAARRSARV